MTATRVSDLANLQVGRLVGEPDEPGALKITPLYAGVDENVTDRKDT